MVTRYQTEQERPVVASPAPTFSLASILAVCCAIASFFVGAIAGVVLAGAAIVLGLVGAVAAMAPGVRGGVASLVSIFAGIAGAVAAAIKLVMYLVGA